jgi:HPt (histidine-containing phosphotransfer) domain-containing protein
LEQRLSEPPGKRSAAAEFHARRYLVQHPPIKAPERLGERIFMIRNRPGSFERLSLGVEDAEQELEPAVILARFDANVRLLQELATIFLEECPRQMAEIREAITREDASALRYSAHQLRGSVANFGTFEAYERARDLEQMARTADLTGAADVYAVLQKAILRFQQVLRQLVAESVPVSEGGQTNP